MAKRKYTRNGEKPVAYKCTKKSCGWEGKDEDKAIKPTSSGWQEHVCPNCLNNEFYGLLEYPKNN